MSLEKKPLSPHLQIYKPQLTSLTSIMHRLTGMFLYLGVVVISWMIVYYTYQINIALSDDNPICDCAIARYLIYTIVVAWAFSLYYHVCNGVRHLFWDIGKGFELEAAKRNAIIVLATASFLTIFSVAFVVLFKFM